MGCLVVDGHTQGSLSVDPVSEGCLLGEGGEWAAPCWGGVGAGRGSAGKGGPECCQLFGEERHGALVFRVFCDVGRLSLRERHPLASLPFYL